MKDFFIFGTSCVISRSYRRICLSLLLLTCLLCTFSPAIGEEQETVFFRPTTGQFPPLEKAYTYRGELVFVDHANRRGSLRIAGAGTYFRNAPHPFAMLPYGIVRYHNAAADLRDIPLGTVLHVDAFLPPDPQFSAVPVLPIDNRDKVDGYSGSGTAPAENHVLLLEDEPSYCQRMGLIWKLQDIEFGGQEWKVVAKREPLAGTDIDNSTEETMTIDAATRIWRGRESLTVADLIAENIWPVAGKKSLEGQTVHLGLIWKPTPNEIFTRFHIADLWLDETSIQRASKLQTETHKAFIRSRWMPAWIDNVEYVKFGRATVTATLFGGMDTSLYADFQKGKTATINASENTLKHAGGAYGPAHMASKGPILEVIKATEDIPLGSSGIQIRVETDLIIEGIRPGRVVRIQPSGWPNVNLPREEYLGNTEYSHEDRFPTPAIFPKY